MYNNMLFVKTIFTIVSILRTACMVRNSKPCNDYNIIILDRCTLISLPLMVWTKASQTQNSNNYEDRNINSGPELRIAPSHWLHSTI